MFNLAKENMQILTLFFNTIRGGRVHMVKDENARDSYARYVPAGNITRDTTYHERHKGFTSA